MTVSYVQELNKGWRRKHDNPKAAAPVTAARICYPATRAELVEICRTQPDGLGLHAAGSHWALSPAALSDDTFIETHDPSNAHPPMAATLSEVVPGRLNPEFFEFLNNLEDRDLFSLVHVEAGKRIYQLYAELDQPMKPNQLSLGLAMYQRFGTTRFSGPWAFETLGGAGGQTVVGAFSTGTHGGDFRQPPIADSVMAIHLVAHGGKQWWIERAPGRMPQLTDDGLLKALYSPLDPEDTNQFEIVRDDEMFAAALVGVGRFGAIYSVILRAVPQYNLYERRRLADWQDVKGLVKQTGGPLYNEAPAPPFALVHTPDPEQRFLQIVVCLTPYANFSRNRVSITKRWTVPWDPMAPLAAPKGRAERVGAIVADFDALTGGPRFAEAGRNFPYDGTGEPGMLEKACSQGAFLAALIEELLQELEEFIGTGGQVAIGTLAQILVPGAGGTVLLLPFLSELARLVRKFLEELGIDDTLAGAMDKLRRLLLGSPASDLLGSQAGILIWQGIAYKIFETIQKNLDLEGVSYAMMDRHDYRQKVCEIDVDSIEVFFDATDDRLITFIDALIAFERGQEFLGRAFLGYASLRFTGPSVALLAEQRWPVTCAVEIACIRGMEGSQQLVDYATALALGPAIRGHLHWGQRNDYTAPHVELRYGSNLAKWRNALGRITEDGARNAFSSDFTRRVGLEL
jgi:hypothetical protein